MPGLSAELHAARLQPINMRQSVALSRNCLFPYRFSRASETENKLPRQGGTMARRAAAPLAALHVAEQQLQCKEIEQLALFSVVAPFVRDDLAIIRQRASRDKLHQTFQLSSSSEGFSDLRF
jgi:hypothetical protein